MEKGYGQIIAESFVKAVTWGLTLAVIYVITTKITLGMVKQDVKDAIDFAQKTAISNTMNAVLSHDVFPRIKQNTKEAIEFTVTAIENEIMGKYYSENLASKKK